MQALVSRSADTPLEWRDLPDRPLRADEVRVSVEAAGVNPVDWKMRELSLLGGVQRVLGPRGPFVTGVDFAGRVIDHGPLVTRVRVGDRVVGGTDFSRQQFGSYARTVQVREDQVTSLPEGVSVVDAACLPVAGVTAQMCLFDLGRLPRRDARDKRVLVLGGAGGVGHFAIQLARNTGAAVFAVCSARNTALVQRLGATPIDYGAGDAIDVARQSGPFDVIVDCIGSKTYPIGRCRALLTPTGRQVLVMPVPADYVQLAFTPRLLTVLGRANGENLAPLVAALANKTLEVVIDQRIPVDEAERAHQVSRAGRVVGKLVLVA